VRWYGHVLRKEDNDLRKEMNAIWSGGARPRGTKKDFERDCGKRQSNIWIEQENAMDHTRWRKL